MHTAPLHRAGPHRCEVDPLRIGMPRLSQCIVDLHSWRAGIDDPRDERLAPTSTENCLDAVFVPHTMVFGHIGGGTDPNHLGLNSRTRRPRRFLSTFPLLALRS